MNSTTELLPCADPVYNPDDWFRVRDDAASRAAKALCGECPRQHKCALWALQNGVTHGIWGGLSADDRRQAWKNKAIYPHGRPTHLDRVMDSWLPQTNSHAVAQQARRENEREAS